MTAKTPQILLSLFAARSAPWRAGRKLMVTGSRRRCRHRGRSRFERRIRRDCRPPMYERAATSGPVVLASCPLGSSSLSPIAIDTENIYPVSGWVMKIPIDGGTPTAVTLRLVGSGRRRGKRLLDGDVIGGAVSVSQAVTRSRSFQTSTNPAPLLSMTRASTGRTTRGEQGESRWRHYRSVGARWGQSDGDCRGQHKCLLDGPQHTRPRRSDESANRQRATTAVASGPEGPGRSWSIQRTFTG
jgi:hypothetical protein